MVIRILHIIDSLQAGGKERQFVELLKGLSRRPGVAACAVVLSETVHFGEFRELGIETHYLRRRSRFDPTVFPRLGRILRGFRPDVVHSWNAMCSVYAAPLARLGGAKFVNGAVRSAPPHIGIGNKDYLFVRLTIPLSHAVAGNSRAGLAAFRIPPAKAVYIPNGFDARRLGRLADAGALRKSLGIETGHVVGMVGTFSDKKDYDAFFRLAQTITAARGDATFVAVGGGENLVRYRRAFDSDRFPRIKLLGQRADVESIANLFSIGVLLSPLGEGFPNAIMEYMALGKPVVATDWPGTRELVEHGRTGFLVAHGDDAALRMRVLELLDDSALAAAMGSEGRARIAAHFSLEAMTDAYVRLYEGLLAQRRRV
jgi:glycosyltransferase involved in cell wall biosynthesis